MTYKGTITSAPISSGQVVPITWINDVENNFEALNSYFHVPLFPESSGAVDANLTGALYSVVSSSAGGTPNVELPVLQFNGTAAAAMGRKWTKSCPPGYNNTFVVRGYYYMPSAGSTNFVLGVRLASLAANGTATSKTYGTQTLGTITASTNAGAITPFSITVSDANNLTAGIPVQIEFERLPANAGDTEAGTVNFVTIDGYFNIG